MRFTNLDVTREFTSELNYCIFSFIALQDPHNSDRNRGFAFVEYYNHACAENAKRLLSLPGFKLGTNIPTINWAECPTGLDNPGSSQVCNILICSLESTVLLYKYCLNQLN